MIDSTAYDEEDDGFAFTRTRAKKARAEPVLPSTAEEYTQERRAEPAPSRRSRKKATASPSAAPPAPVESQEKTTKRRSARHSGEHENADPQVLPVKKRRKDRASSEMKQDHVEERSHKEQDQSEQGPQQEHKQKDQDRSRHETQQEHTQPIEITFDATKIALPFADTPIIRRNKEMRNRATNGSRRSSLGMRGRRASSLIGTGKSDGKGLLFAFWVASLTIA